MLVVVAEVVVVVVVVVLVAALVVDCSTTLSLFVFFSLLSLLLSLFLCFSLLSLLLFVSCHIFYIKICSNLVYGPLTYTFPISSLVSFP